MKVLVTGATGFIGSQICRALVASGESVRAFHRANSPLTGLAGLPVEHAIGDVTQPETLKTALQGIEVVFHTAAQLGQPRDPTQMYAVTVGGTRNLLQAARQVGTRRVVHTSSVAALGVPASQAMAARRQDRRDPLPMNECHTWNYRPEWWRYGHAKYLAEMEVQGAVAQGLEVVIVNPAVVVGAGDLNRISGNVILHVARGHVPVGASGGLNVIHIADAVRGHLAALERGRPGERYILGGENLTHMDFLKIVAQICGVRAPRFALPARLVRALARPLSVAGTRLPLPISGDALRKAGYFFYYDTSKARAELGLPEPQSVRQAISEAYAWYQAQGVI